MSSNRALLILSLAASAALGACATIADSSAGLAPPAARLSTEQYPLTVNEQPAELLLAPHEQGLSQAQAAALADFGRRWRSNSTTDIVIEAASQGGAGAYQTSHAAADLLASQGVPVRIVGYNADPGAPVRLSFLAAEAAVYDCNRSWDRLTATHDNTVPVNFGCAISANRAAMIADAADIVRPRAEDPVDAARRQTVLDRYRRGEVSTSAKDDQGSVTVSHAVN
jgi:pilus assembly protein CpaD